MHGQEISMTIRKNFQPDLDGTLHISFRRSCVYSGPATRTLDPNNVYYNPQEDVYIQDMSFAAGMKGTFGKTGIGISAM